MGREEMFVCTVLHKNVLEQELLFHLGRMIFSELGGSYEGGVRSISGDTIHVQH